MQRVRTSLVGLVLLTLVGGAAEGATREVVWRGSGGWGAGMPYAQHFERGNREKLNGTVVRMERIVPLPGMADGYGLTLRTREQPMSVHLGPVWYLERQDFPIEVDDVVEVLGVRVVLEGQTVLLATEVRKKGKVLSLRSEAGLPLWSAWRNQ